MAECKEQVMARLSKAVVQKKALAREDLIAHLVNRLHDRNRQDEAEIFEIPIKGTETIHAIVVWERWTTITSFKEREAVIREAYERFDRELDPEQQISPKITLVLGVTAKEAIGNNLLPYTVNPVIDPSDPRVSELRRIMKEAHAIESSMNMLGIHLAFPTREMRDQARLKVQNKMPDIRWVKVQNHCQTDDD
jgi:hypothetical protein